MLKAMTTTLAAGALLLGLASAASAATKPQVRAQHAENHTNTLVGDPASRGLLGTDCTINGTYHDWPYCFGSDHPGGTRIGAPIQTRSAY